MIVATSLSRSRALIARRETTSWFVLGSLVVVSTMARGVLAHWHTAPRYFPDEYIYTALSRSLAHGHVQVRDQPAHFYAILQPLVAAPLWQFFRVQTAYTLVQFENALAASLVVVPVWMLGRDLGLAKRSIYLASIYSLILPTLVMVSSTVSDFVAYPLAVAGVAAAVRSLKEPTARRQFMFLAIVFLATLARIQYFVLVPAYLVGALALDRRAALRRHPVAFLAIVPAVVGAVLAATGYYAIGTGTFSGPMVTWVPLEAFLLTATAGVVIVPGAVAAILRPQGRSQAAFAWMASVLIVLTLIEASLPGAKEGRFKERYLFALLPLVALAFGVYVKNARSHKWIVLLVAGALIAAAPQLPFSYYNAYAPQYDAWSLTASWLLKQHLGASTSSAVIALYVTAAAALAILIAIRLRVATLAMPFAIGAVLITTVAAIHVDFSYNYHATDRSWIAAASHGQPVTAVATPSSSHFGLLKQLYWSPVVNREVVLASAVPTDAFVKEQIKISRDGALGGINGGYFLFDRGGTQASFSGAAFVTGHDEYALYHSRTTPRFRILIENRNPTGWIAQIARLREWPLQQTERPGVLFTLSLPLRSRHSIHVKLGTEPFVLRPGTHIPITCGSTTWPLTVLLVARESTADAQGRRVSVRLTDVKSASGGPLTKSGTRCTRARP